MITQQDIKTLDEWIIHSCAPNTVRTWHAQVIAELIDYIHYLEIELVDTKIKNTDLSEQLRFSLHERT